MAQLGYIGREPLRLATAKTPLPAEPNYTTDLTPADLNTTSPSQHHKEKMGDSSAVEEHLLVLELATLEDVPALTNLWYEAFTDPAARHIWPDTPGVRKWWDDANREDMINKPFQRYVKVVDPKSKDASGRPRIAAYAKWDMAMPDERGRRFPPWHEDMHKKDCDSFLGTLEGNRKRVFGDSKNYYLDMLCTHPDYRKRGAGSMLIKFGCDLADEHGVGAYVDASKAGAPLYAKWGFVDETGPDGGEVAAMARRYVEV